MNLRTCMATILLAGALAIEPAAAATYRVDDSASRVLGGSLRMRWDSPTPQSGRAGLSGEVEVLVNLDVSPWRGRQGRIFITLPPVPSGPVTATWNTRGVLLPGTLRAGERALVYNGLVSTDRIEDALRLVILADGNRLVRAEQLDFTFEIDLGTP